MVVGRLLILSYLMPSAAISCRFFAMRASTPLLCHGKRPPTTEEAAAARPYNEGNPPPAGDPVAIDLMEKAKYFLAMKNTGDLDAIFEMSAPDADVYGFVGEGSYRKGLTTYFATHRMLLHVLIGDPEPVGQTAVQYSFEKSWLDADGELQVWKSVDPVPEGQDGRPGKPRDKVECLEFDSAGRLVKVSIVERGHVDD